MNRRGFTVIELIVTITIIAILLVLGVASFRSTQANARDTERHADVQSIAKHLETYFSSNTSGQTGSGKGSYLGANLLGTETALRTYLNDIDPKVLRAPGRKVTDPSSFIPATTSNQNTTGLGSLANIELYVYQPLTTNGALCQNNLTGETCRKFNLFYRLEVATPDCPAPANICKLSSVNQ